ncbi:unnamed protein product, partial [Cyprideis torosa]
MSPIISIVIPVYNKSEYLVQTIESILKSDYSHFEIVVVDDGSKDDLEPVISELLKKDKRIIFHRQENAGVCVARNRGIAMARGKFILPLDADDLIGKQYLSKAVKILEDRPEVSLVYPKARFKQVNQMAKVSVIVPVYNTALYLDKCLSSLLNQSFTDIEVIVVNDGSTDNSQEIIDHYGNLDGRIRVYKKENGGLSDSRNYGLGQIQGDYIAFVDSDDWIDVDMIEKMHNLATHSLADIVICDLERVNEKGEHLDVLSQSPQLPEVIDLEKDFSIF